MSSEELVKKILRFRPYFGENGGATFSGGEPLLQSEFLHEVAILLKREKISYVLDTSGHIDLSDEVCFLLDHAQEVLLDLKFWDDSSYLYYTGKGMQKTLNVLKYLDDIGKKTVIRTVVIPDVNDSEKHISAYVDLFRQYSCVTKYELLPFHTMGFFKYERLNLKNPFAGKKPLSKEKLATLQKFADQIRKNG